MRRDHFIHLHVHSEHSLFDGMAKVKDLVKRTADLGVPAMALTDHGAVSGWAELHRYAHAVGVLPIFGVEAYVVEDMRMHVKQQRRHMVLLAISAEGMANLTTLVSLSAMYHYYKPVMGIETIAKYSRGIVATTACLGGWCARPFFSQTGYEGDGTPKIAYDEYHRLRDIFRDRLYLEIQPYAQASQRVFNDWALHLHETEGARLVATNDIHYLNPEDAEIHPYFVMAGMGAWARKGADGYNDGVEKYVSKPGGIHYRTRAEMFDAFVALHGPGILDHRGLQHAMDTPYDIYAECAAIRFNTELKIPVFSAPEIPPGV